MLAILLTKIPMILALLRQNSFLYTAIAHIVLQDHERIEFHFQKAIKLDTFLLRLISPVTEGPLLPVGSLSILNHHNSIRMQMVSNIITIILCS